MVAELQQLCLGQSNGSDRNASALLSERAKQFQIGQDLNAMRCAEALHFFREKIRVSRTNDICVSCQRCA
jgi:hypothetical protein